MIPPAELDALRQRYGLDQELAADPEPQAIYQLFSPEISGGMGILSGDHQFIYARLIRTLANNIAHAHDLDLEQAMTFLCELPPNLLTHFDSPQGWTFLASAAALHFGCDEPAFIPTVH